MYHEAWHTWSPIEEFPLPLKLSGTCGPERIIKFWSHRGTKKVWNSAQLGPDLDQSAKNVPM